jgi:hypothetical protein
MYQVKSLYTSGKAAVTTGPRGQLCGDWPVASRGAPATECAALDTVSQDHKSVH